MQPFTTLTAVAAPLDAADIDTNQLSPTQFSKLPRGPRYAQVLFHEHRFHANGAEKDHILNRPPYRSAGILVADRNFGCGSSREHAVWALYEFGIRSVIAPSFGDIFITNCYKNGLLPVALGDAEAAALRRALHDVPGSSIAIDLQAQTVADGAGHLYRFEIPAVRRKCLLEGLDDIARTEQYLAQFEAYEAAYCERYRWTHAGGSAVQPESLNKGITG